MAANLYDVLRKYENNMIAFVGMAKNTGKTTALNQAVKEAHRADKKLGILSYGRDGEEFDEITRKQKPSIKIPPDTYFVTADSRVENRTGLCQVITRLQVETNIGEINLYKSGSHLLKPLELELIGINRISDLRRVKNLISDTCDFVFVDGALDRKSSALPELTEGVILSTGAVLSRNINHIVEKTDSLLRVLKLPGLSDLHLRNYFLKILHKNRKNLSGFLYRADGEKIIKLNSDTSFDLRGELEKIAQDGYFRDKIGDENEDFFLVLAGAFTSGLCDFLLSHDYYHCFNLIIKDPTRIFITGDDIKRLEQKNIKIRMLNTMRLLALTVNPHNPVGRDVSSKKIKSELKKYWPDLPIFDVKSDNYLEQFKQ